MAICNKYPILFMNEKDFTVQEVCTSLTRHLVCFLQMLPRMNIYL